MTTTNFESQTFVIAKFDGENEKSVADRKIIMNEFSVKIKMKRNETFKSTKKSVLKIKIVKHPGKCF